MDTSIESPDKDERKSKLNNLVAISIVILVTFMAVTKVKDDNIVQAMLQLKSDAVDTWAQFQAKRIRRSLMETSRDQATALRASAPAPTAALLDEQIGRYESEIARYKNEETDLQKQAKDAEAKYDAFNYRDDQFDLSDASVSLAVALLAVVSLTGKRWLMWMAWLFGLFGLVMGLAGLLGWRLHPDWLTKLLS